MESVLNNGRHIQGDSVGKVNMLLRNGVGHCKKKKGLYEHLSAQSQWPNRLMRGSAVGCLLAMRVRIPCGGMDIYLVSVVCC